MQVKLKVNRVASGHRQRRGQTYDLPQAEALTLLKSGRAEAVTADPPAPPRGGKAPQSKTRNTPPGPGRAQRSR